MLLPPRNCCIRHAAALFKGLLASRVQQMILRLPPSEPPPMRGRRGRPKGMASNEKTLDSAAAGCRRDERMFLGVPWTGGAKAPIEGASIEDTTRAAVITTMVGTTTTTNWPYVMIFQA